MFKRSLTLSADTITLYAPSAKYFRSYEKNSVAANGHPIPEAEGNAVAEEEAAGLKKDVNDLVRRLSTQRGSDVYSHAAAVVKDLLGKFLANDSGASGSDTSCSKGPAVPPPPAGAIGTGGITPQERPLDGSFRSAVSNATGTTHDGGFHHQRASSRLPHDFGSFAFDQSVAELLGGAEDIGTVGGGGVGANSSGKLNSPLLSAAPIVKFSLINFFHEHGSRRRGVDETDKEIDRTTHFQDIAAADLHAQQTATTTSPAISPRLGHHHARTESMTTLFNANRFGTTSPGLLSSPIPVTRHTAGSSSSIAASAMLNAAQQQASASQHFTQQFKARMNNEYERLWAGRAAASRAVLEDGVCDLRPVFRVHYPPSNAKEDESEDDDTSSSNDEPDATCFITFIGSWLPRITPMMRIISNTDVSLSLDEPLLHAFELFFDLMDALTMKNVGMTTVFGCKFADDRLLPMRRFSKVRMAAGGAFEDRFLARDDYLAMNGILSPSEVPRGEQYPQMIPSFNAESLTDGICIDLDFRRRFVLETCHDYSQIAARPAQPLPLPPDRQAASATQVAQANAVNSAVGINAAGGDGVASPLSNTVVSNSDGAADSVSGGESSEAASLQNAFLSRLPHGVSSKHHPVVRLIAEKGVMIRWRNSGAANQTKLVARRPYLMVHKYVGRNQDLPAMKFPSGWQHQDRLLPQGQHGALYEVLAMPKARAGNVSETTFVGKTSSSSKSQSQPKQGDPLPLGDGSLTFEFKIVYKPSNMAMQDWALLASTSGSQITDPKEVLTSRAASSNINTTGYMFTHYLTLLCDNLALNYVQTTLWPLLEHFTNGFITRSAYITGRGQLSLASPLADRQWSWKRVYAHNDKVAAAMDGLCARQQFPSNNPNTPKPSPSTGHWHGNTPNPLEDLTCFPQSGAGRSDPSIVPPYVLNLLHQSIELRNVDAILPFHEDHCANILARADSIAMWSDIKEIQQTAARDISGLDYSGLAAPASADCATCFKMSFDGMRMWVATDPSLSYLPQQTSTQQQAAHSNQQHASGSTAPPRSVRVAAHAKTLWELSPNLSQSALPHMRTTSSIGAHSHSWGKRGIHPHHHDRVLSGSSTPPIPLSGSSENVQHLHHSITSSADGHFPVPIGGVVTNAKGMPVTGASAPVMHERLPSAVPLHIHVGSDVMDPNHHRSQSEPAVSNATSFARYPMTVAGYAAATDGYNGPATPTFHNGSNANQYPKSIISPPTKGDVVRPRTKTVIIDDPSASFRHEHNSLHSPDGDLGSSPLGGGTNESVVNNFPANFSTCLLGLTTVPTVTSIVHNPDGTKRYVCKLTATTRDMTEVVSGMRCEFSITWEMNNPHQRLSEKHMNLQFGDFMFHGSSKQMAAVCDWVCGCFMEPYVSLYPAKYQNPKAFVVWSQWIERHHPDIFKAYSPQPGAMTGVGAATRVLSPMSSRPSGEWTIGAQRMCLHLIDPETKIRAARITEGGAGGGGGAGSVGRRRAPSRAPAGSNASPSSASSPGSGRAQQPEVPAGPTIVRDPINICIDITKGALMNIKWMRDGSFRSRYSFGAISGWDLTVGALRSSTKGNSKFIDSVREVVTSRRRFLRIEHNAPWKLRLDEAEGKLPSPTGNTNNNDEEPPEPKSPSSPTTSSKQSYPASQLATRSKAQLGPNVAAPAGAPKGKSRSFGDGGLGFDPTTAGLDVFYGYTVGGPDQKVVYMDLTVDSLDLQLIPRFAVDVKDSLMGLTLRNSMAPMFKWPCYSIGETPKPADPNAQQWRSENNIKVGAVYFVLLEDPRARKPLPLYFMTLRGITFTNASDALGANKCLTFRVTDISSNGIVSDRDKVFPIVARQTPENEEQRRIKNLIEVKKDKNGLKGVVGCLWFVSPLKDRLFKLKAAASHPSMSELSWLSTYAEERSALLLQNTSVNTTVGSPKEPPKPLTAEDNIFIVVHNPRLIIAEHSSIETANKTGIIINFGLIEIGKAVVFGNNINGNSSQQAGTGLNYKAVFSRFNVSSLHSVDHYLLQPSDITAEALVSADGLTTTAAIDIQKMHIDVAQEYYELVLHSAARHLVADEDNLISKREAQAAQLSSAGSTKHSDSEYSKANTTAPGISLRTIDHQTGEIRRRLMSLRKRKTTSAAALNASMSQSLLVALPLENLSATVRWESLRLRVHSEDVAVFVSVADMKVSYANSKPKLPEGLLPAATIPVSKDAEGQETLLVLRPPSGSMAEAAMNGSLPDEDDRDGEDRSPFVRHLVTVGSRMPDTSGALMTVVPASSMNVEGSIGRLEVGVEGGPPLISLSAPKEDSIRFSSTDYKMVVDADTGALKCTLEHSTVIQAVTFLYEPYRRIVLPRYGVAQILNYSHWLYDISHRLVLSSRTVAHFSSAEYNHITLNCGGNEVHLIDGSAPILLLEPGLTVVISNAKLHLYGHPIEHYASTANGSYIIVDDTCEVIVPVKPEEGTSTGSDEDLLTDGTDEEYDPEAGLNEHEAFDAKTAPPSAFLLSDPNTTAATSISSTASPSQLSPTQKGPSFARKSSKKRMIHGPESPAFARGNTDSPPPPSVTTVTLSDTANSSQAVFTLQSQVPLLLPKKFQPTSRQIDAKGSVELALPEIVAAGTQFFSKAKRALSVKMQLIVGHGQTLTPDVEETGSLSKEGIDAFYSVGDPLPPDDGGLLTSPTRSNGGGLQSIKVPTIIMSVSEQACAFLKDMYAECEYFTKNSHVRSDFSTLLTPWEVRMTVIGSDAPIPTNTETALDLAATYGPASTTAGTSISAAISAAASTAAPPRVMRRKVFIEADRRVDFRLRYGDITLVTSSVDQLKRAVGHIEQQVLGAAPADQHGFEHLSRDSEEQQQKAAAKVSALTVVTNVKQIVLFVVDDSMFGANTDVPLMSISISNILTPVLEFSAYATKIHASAELDIEYYNINTGAWSPLLEPVEFDFVLRSNKNVTLEDVVSRKGNRKAGVHMRSMNFHATPVLAQVIARLLQLKNRLKESNDPTAIANAAATAAAAAAATPTLTSPSATTAAVKKPTGANSTTVSFGGDLSSPTTKETNAFSAYTVTQQLGHNIEIEFCDANGLRRAEISHKKLHSQESISFDYPRDLSDTRDGSKDHPIAEHCINVIIRRGDTVTGGPDEDDEELVTTQSTDGSSQSVGHPTPEFSFGKATIWLARVGTSCINVGLPTKPRYIVVEVLVNQGTKKIMLRTNVSFTNKLPFGVTFRQIGCIQPGTKVTVPRETLRKRCSFLPTVPGGAPDEISMGVSYDALHNFFAQQFLCTARIPRTSNRVNSSATNRARSDTFMPDDEIQQAHHIVLNFDPLKAIPYSDILDCHATLEAPFNIVNNTGQPLHVTFHYRKLFAKKSFFRSDEYHFPMIDKIAVDTEECYPVTQVDPFLDLYISVQMSQPTGDSLASRSKSKTCVLVRSVQSSDDRASYIKLVDTRGEELELRITYRGKDIVLDCPFWVVNQTEHYIQITTTSIKRRQNCVVAGMSGDGLGPLVSTPFLIHTPKMKKDPIDAHLYVRVGRHTSSGELMWSQWSDKVFINAIGEMSVITCGANGECISLSYSVAFAGGKLKETRVVKITPRWIIINRCKHPLIIRQNTGREDTPISVQQQSRKSTDGPQLTPGLLRVLDTCTVSNGPNLITIKHGEGRSVFSAPISIDRLGDHALNIRYVASVFDKEHQTMVSIEKSYVVHVTCYARASTLFISIDEPEKPPHLIENRTRFQLHVRQRDTANQVSIYRLRTSGFVWEDAQAPKVLQMWISENTASSKAVSINLDPSMLVKREHQLSQVIRTNGGIDLYVRVRAFGGSYAISVTEDDRIDRARILPFHQYKYQMQIDSVNLLMADAGGDILLLTLGHKSGLKASITQGRLKEGESDEQVIELSCGIIQLADERPETTQRVVLQNINRPSTVRICRRLQRMTPMLQIAAFEVALQPITIHLTDSFIYVAYNLYERFTEAIGRSERAVKQSDFATTPWYLELSTPITSQDSVQNRVAFVEKLSISQLTVSFSLYRNDGDDDLIGDRFGFVSLLIRSVNDARFDWRRIDYDNIYDRLWLLATFLSNYYSVELQRQLLNVVHVAGLDVMRGFVTDLLEGYFASTAPVSIGKSAALVPLRDEIKFRQDTNERKDDEAHPVQQVAIRQMTVRQRGSTGGKLDSHLSGHSGYKEVRVGGLLGRTEKISMEQYADRVSFADFVANVTKQEFKVFGHLAVRRYLRTRDFTVSPILLCNRCIDIETMRDNHAEGNYNSVLPHPNSRHISWAELAHHASWEEMTELCAAEELVIHAETLKSGLAGTPTNVVRIDATMAANIRQTTRSETVGGQPARTGAASLDDNDAA